MSAPMAVRSITVALIVATCLSLPKAGYAAELEIDYQQRLCAGLFINRHLKNGTEVDCVSDTHAIEVDFTEKWAEAIGQSLQYASKRQRLPGIILICGPTTVRASVLASLPDRGDDEILARRHDALAVRQRVCGPGGLYPPGDLRFG